MESGSGKLSRKEKGRIEMKNYWYLTRVMLRNMLSSMNPAHGTYADGKKKQKAVMRTVAIACLAVGALASVIYVEYLLFKGLDQMKMPMMLPGLAIFASLMFTLVLGLFQCLSELFQGKDAPFLAVLPLTSRQVFTARLTTLYLMELATDLLICVPAFVLYAIGQGSAWPMAATVLPVLLLLPMIPLSIVALLASLLMRVSFFSRHRDTIVMVLSALLAIAYSITVTMMNSSSTDPSEAVAMLIRPDGLLEKILGIFPPAMWAAKGLTGDAGMLLLYAAVSLVCAAGVILLAGPGYLEQALSSTERTVIRRKKGEVKHEWTVSSAFRTLHTLEWRELLRTPAWAYNSLLGVVMFPLMISIGMVVGVSRGGESMGALREMLNDVDPAYVALVTAAVMALGAMVNPAVSTAISREGGRWPFALTLPVHQKTRFMAKLMVGAEINLICMGLIGAVAWFLVRMPILWLLAAFLVSGMIGLAAAVISLWVDATRPQLNWTTEMEAIKKNFNQVIGMILWAVMTGLCVVPAVWLWNRSASLALAASGGVALLELVASWLLLGRATDKNLVMQEN